MSEQNGPRSPRGPWSAFVTAFLAGACHQPETTTGTEAMTSGAAPTTAAEPTTLSPATDAPTEATPSTTLGQGTSSDATSGPGDDCAALEHPTPGELNPQVVAECDALCTHYHECGLKEHDLCQMGCVARSGSDHEECYDTGSAARACLSAMTCDELGAYLQFNKAGPCTQQLEDQHQACTCQATSISGDGLCGYNLDCPYVPFRQLYCHQGICECKVDDAVVKTCPQDNICDDFPGFDAYEACCCA